MINHTPGPWTVSEINAAGNVDEFAIFIEPNVAVIERKIEGQNECDMPDAHLIAAAPDLLAALESLICIGDWACATTAGSIEDELPEEFAAARSAIARVKGGAE